MINEISSKQVSVSKYEGNTKVNTNGASEKAQTAGQEPAAILDLGKSGHNSSGIYSRPQTTGSSEKKTDTKVNAEEINRLWAEANRATQNLRDLVKKLLESQGKTFKDVLSGKEELVVDEETRAAAAQAISEDGESGVKAVSDRIVAFAKTISNDNPEMYDKLMSAIDEGFAQAEKALGGELPEICKKTREEINRKMEEWKAGKDTVEE